MHALALDQLAEPFAVLAFFHPPVPDLFDQLFELAERRLHFHERHGQGGHLSAFEDRGLGAEQDRRARVLPDSEGSGHDIEAVHASSALFVVDFQFAAVPAHAFGRAQADDFLLDVEFAPVSSGMGTGIGHEFAADVRLDRGLIDADVVSPGPDNGHVGTSDGGHATVGAAVEFELELVRESRPMEFVLILVSHIVTAFLRVVTGELASGHCRDSIQGFSGSTLNRLSPDSIHGSARRTAVPDDR